MKGQRGAALVEFALLFPLLAMLCLGTVDLGRAFKASNEVKNAAREAASFAQTHPGQLISGASCADPNNAVWHALNESDTPATSYTVTFNGGGGGCNPAGPLVASGANLTVTVSRPFTVLTPLVRTATGGDPTIRASVTVRVQ
jgi:Flp pilus assembly protein TadG